MLADVVPEHAQRRRSTVKVQHFGLFVLLEQTPQLDPAFQLAPASPGMPAVWVPSLTLTGVAGSALVVRQLEGAPGGSWTESLLVPAELLLLEVQGRTAPQEH
jgi:hypothetical protein